VSSRPRRNPDRATSTTARPTTNRRVSNLLEQQQKPRFPMRHKELSWSGLGHPDAASELPGSGLEHARVGSRYPAFELNVHSELLQPLIIFFNAVAGEIGRDYITMKHTLFLLVILSILPSTDAFIFDLIRNIFCAIPLLKLLVNCGDDEVGSPPVPPPVSPPTGAPVLQTMIEPTAGPTNNPTTSPSEPPTNNPTTSPTFDDKCDPFPW